MSGSTVISHISSKGGVGKTTLTLLSALETVRTKQRKASVCSRDLLAKLSSLVGADFTDLDITDPRFEEIFAARFKSLGKEPLGEVLDAICHLKELLKLSKVEIVDLDPNRFCKKWFEKGSAPNGLIVSVPEKGKSEGRLIAEAGERAGTVFIDVEGTANKGNIVSVLMSDIVVAVSQASEMDKQEALKTLSLVEEAELSGNKKIHAFLLLNRVRPLGETKIEKGILQVFEEQGKRAFQTRIVEREIYKSFYEEGLSLEDMPSSSARKKAQENILEYVKELRKFSKEI